MLDSRTGKYALRGLDPAQDDTGYYFPDIFVDAFAVHAEGPGAPPRDMPEGRRFSVEESKALIVGALAGFDPAMAQQAREILATALAREGGPAAMPFNAAAHDGNPYLKSDYRLAVAEGSRWNLALVEPGQARLMRCLPAASPQREIMPGFFDPANPHDQAVIEFHFDGTIDAVAYMAHELGHAMADDCQRAAGNSFRDNPVHLAETQAYLVQHIVYDALRGHDDPAVAQAAEAHYRATMAGIRGGLADVETLHGRPMSLLCARALLLQLQGQDDETRHRAAMMLMGGEGPVAISQIFEAAGVQTADDLARLARASWQDAAPPEPPPASGMKPAHSMGQG